MPATTVNDQRLRMRELSALSGLSKSAIRYYITEGLVPGPVERGRNSALYSGRTLHALEQVKHLREEERFSIAMIRHAVEQVGPDAPTEDIEELGRALAALGGDTPTLVLASLCKQSGLSAQEVRRAERAGLLVPLPGGRGGKTYDEGDLSAAQALKELLALGVTWKELEAFGEAARRVLELQVNLQQRLIKSRDQRGVLRVSGALLRIGRVTNQYLFNRNLKRAVMEQLHTMKGDMHHGH